MFWLRTIKNYFLIIINYPPNLFLWLLLHELQDSLNFSKVVYVIVLFPVKVIFICL